MSLDSSLNPSPFSRLIQDFAARAGIDADDDVFGLEFEHEGLLASVLPHPRLERLIAEVSLGELDFGEIQAPEQALLFLHQLNDRARREHDWVITVDEQLGLTLSLQARLSELDGAGLQALLDEGLGLAQALQVMLASVTRAPAASPGDLLGQGSAAVLRV
jgi:hypothetical protein